VDKYLMMKKVENKVHLLEKMNEIYTVAFNAGYKDLVLSSLKTVINLQNSIRNSNRDSIFLKLLDNMKDERISKELSHVMELKISSILS
jgi:hypothetical protein